MRRASTFSILLTLAVSLASSATAAPKNFTGTLTLRLPFGGASPVVSGSGTGSSDGRFQPATIAGGEFAVHATVPVGTPILSAVEIAAPLSPGVPGSNGPLDWDGSSGTMQLNASAFLRGFGTILGAVPLTVVGVGGSQVFSAGFNGTIVGGRYRTGYVPLSGTSRGISFFSGSVYGYDSRSPNGNGLLQIVAPTVIRLNIPATLPAAAVLRLEFTSPPPSNDDFAAAIPVPSVPFEDSADLNGATREPGEPSPSCSFFSGYGTAWWAFTPSETQTLSFLASLGYSESAAVYIGASLGDLSEIACVGSFGSGQDHFVAEAGETYFIQLSSYTVRQFELDLAPPPVIDFITVDPPDPSKFDLVEFFASTFDPAGFGIETFEWDFGDGSTAEGCCPEHQYAEGQYTVELTVTTTDGRSASSSREVAVETHDVAITKFSAPTSGRTGQTRTFVVGVASKLQTETVRVTLYRSVPGFSSFTEVGSSVQSVPVRGGNRTTDFKFSYTFTAQDAQIGKVTFRAVAEIVGERDALPGDNQAIAPPTKVNR